MKRPAARGLALAAAALAFDPLVPALLPKATLVLVVALAMAALDLDRLRTGPALVLAASLAAWLGLSLLWSGHPEPTVLAPWLVMALVGLAVSGGDAREHEADARAYARGVASVAGLLAIGQGLLGRPIEAGFGNPNALGLAVAPCLPLLLTPREETGVIALESSVFQRTRARLMVGAPFVLGLVAVVLGRSRSAWVGLALSTAWLMRGRSRWLSLLPVVALAAGLFAGREAVVGALGGRAWIARVDLRASLEALPLGVGLGGFPFAFLETQAGLLRGLSSERAAARFVHAVTPHGDWLGLLATGGPLALALALATLALAHRRSVRPEHRAALLVVGLAALGDDALALVPVSTLLGLLLPPGAGPRRAARRGRLLASLILVGAAALLLPALVRRHASQRLLRLAEAATAEPGAHRELIDRARRIDPEDGEAALASGLAWLTAREPERAIPELEFASGRLANVGTSTALGNAHLELGHVGAAIAAYQEATRLDPGSFRAHANLVEARRRAGDLAGAERALVSARQLQPHHPKLERMAEALRRDRMELESRGVLR